MVSAIIDADCQIRKHYANTDLGNIHYTLHHHTLWKITKPSPCFIKLPYTPSTLSILRSPLPPSRLEANDYLI